MITRTTLIDLFHHARKHSAYYQNLYQSVSENWTLKDLPLVEPGHYWAHSNDLQTWPVLTASPEGGHVYKTGGSTSDGRLSVFSQQEWKAFIRVFGQGIAHQLRSGDRVANLFFAGDLYTSFIFIHGALSNAPLPIVEFPFTCKVEDELLASNIKLHNINVLAGVPVQLIRFAHYLKDTGQTLPMVETILYGGESLFDSQTAIIRDVFPQARLGSIGCASVDAGLIGFADPQCQQGEHRTFDEDTIVEIVDEITHQPITTPRRNGLLVVTNLQRRLMPVIRYPTGDLACWCEPEQKYRKFALQGRANQGYRIRFGTLSLFPDDLAAQLAQQTELLAWQLELSQQSGQDKLRLLVASLQAVDIDKIRHSVLTAFPSLDRDCTEQSMLEIVQTNIDSMHTHPRSGKLQRVVDLRSHS
ncbi:phenylacetate--CoA ligase family protein [Xenorhabdus nematophila]|uniref:AMP-dependent synthetase n=1 Tax=Xenorhabdus nematophila TaxID=628 RepID=UPI0005429DAE|nr:AMP-dependent synthetase [Xenorhabdus nematophila]CEE92018.1 Putative AMP-dependent synthetase/ligase [Xenorhabdus nematophila str. Anatoliense]CEF32131.1 Putative AMP-dependent synthetase/ligase [Xenorhabdus nematophila str. Websteri]AYA41713.1 phenylacetate--CoA ligase family protein [Xenorhabdus nematophila]MBA0020452.1 phenylacetate--CoA ligase family protein [Xenorhabdus nematophila]MCB4426231.1 phenylacetate--CoA ligase family protein [Xenorhabdus nematophila]